MQNSQQFQLPYLLHLPSLSFRPSETWLPFISFTRYQSSIIKWSKFTSVFVDSWYVRKKLQSKVDEGLRALKAVIVKHNTGVITGNEKLPSLHFLHSAQGQFLHRLLVPLPLFQAFFPSIDAQCPFSLS